MANVGIKIKVSATAKLIRERGAEMRANPDEAITIARKYNKAGLDKLIVKAFEKSEIIQTMPLLGVINNFVKNGVRHG